MQILLCLVLLASSPCLFAQDEPGEAPGCLDSAAIEYVNACGFQSVRQVEKFFGKEYSEIDDDIGEDMLQCILWDLKTICMENRNREKCGEDFAKRNREEMEEARGFVVNEDCEFYMEQILSKEDDLGEDFRQKVTLL